jgi:hypothetical protein
MTVLFAHDFVDAACKTNNIGGPYMKKASVEGITKSAFSILHTLNHHKYY